MNFDNQQKKKEHFVESSISEAHPPEKVQTNGLKKKEKSKVSLRLSQPENSEIALANDYYDIIKDVVMEPDFEPTFTLHTDTQLPSIPLIQDILVKINFLFTYADKDRLFSFNLLVSPETKIQELIRAAVIKFNDEKFMLDSDLKATHVVKLEEDISEYELKPTSKKNNYPKLDLPSFCKGARLCNTNTQSFSLVTKPEHVVIVPVIEKPQRKGCKKWRQMCSLL